jgi:signal transduction histidine kinase
MDDYSEATGPIADAVRSSDPRSVVATPIIVAGRRWGAMLVGTFGEQPVPADCEGRLGEFTELMATAIANADARAELIASRARIVTAGDEARRRIERNLHDGTQQRLIALGLDLQHVRMLLPPDEVDAIESLERAQRDVESILEDVRELSRGLHPATLSRGGLQLALRALVLKSPIPVQLTIDQRERPPASIETAAYYVVSEALANAIRYSHGSEIGITIEVEDRDLCASVVDDGVGGASPTPGSGLAGLIDRVDALGGRFDLDSPIGRGTRISIAIPLEGPLSRRMELAGLKPATSWAR